MENKALRVVFPIFLGILIALLVGFGVQVFYPQPEMYVGPRGGSENTYLAYRQTLQDYNGIVSGAVSAIGAVPLVVGSLLPKRLVVIADGLLLGGVFTLVYAAGRGMGATAGLGTAASFAAVGVGFLLALAALFVRQTGWTLRRKARASSSSDVDDATLAVVFPLAAAPLAAMVVSLGIQAFYAQPYLGGYFGSGYPDTMAVYGRNFALIASSAAVVLLAAGFALVRRASIPADALLLGGLVALVMGTTRAISPRTAVVSFVVGVFALLVALVVGHLRMVGRRWLPAVEADGSGPRAGSRMFAVLHPLATGVLAVVVFFVGINAFYPEPMVGGTQSAWLRTVSLSATIVAVVLLVASLALGRISSADANALLVSGLFTLVAGVVPAAMAGEQTIVFIALAVALVVVLFVGYRRFAGRGRGPKAPMGAPPLPPAPAA